MSRSEPLAATARDRVRAVRDDPESRYLLREAFYARYGFPRARPAGYGHLELAFLRWEIDRGALNPPDHDRPGSPWWRSINDRLLEHGELAALAHEAGLPSQELPGPARLWGEYLTSPSAASWYRAHNASIVDGYLGAMELAQREDEPEQRLMNRLLNRLLHAHALILSGKPLDAKWSPDPEGPLADHLFTSGSLYPRSYPLSESDLQQIEQIGGRAHVLDERIRPDLPAIYAEHARLLGAPDLARLIRGDVTTYPRFAS